MSGLLQQTYFGNTLQTWVIAFSIVILSLMLGKVVYWIFSRIVRGFTSRTKAKIDDLIVDMVEEPMVFFLISAGIWFGLKQLVLPEAFEAAIDNSFQVLVALLAGWLASRLFDAVCQEYLLPWVEKSENDLDDQLLPILRKASDRDDRGNNRLSKIECVLGTWMSQNASRDQRLAYIYYISKGADIANTKTEINMEILRQFNENGLEFAFPTQTLYTIEAGTA